MMNRSLPMQTNQLILEGPDLVGKTTLFAALHKKTDFRWNIQDRSSLSMICYARQFNRSTLIEKDRLDQELNNLNNKMIILLPPLSVIEKRYLERGDEIQDIDSLRALYDIFLEESNKIRFRPNVMFIKTPMSPEELVMSIEEWTYSLETCDLNHMGDVIKDTLHGSDADEMTLDARVVYDLDEPNSDILNNSLEGEYYKEILNSTMKTIQDELDGKNDYNIAQTRNSRRFFYSSSTCISSIHFMPRASCLKTHVVFRSLDVDNNAGIDLEFINFLISKVNKEFRFNCNNADVSIRFNNAHIRRGIAQ